jgi:hypothetical protein
MKLKFIVALLLILFVNSFAFSKENCKCIKSEMGCNNGSGKSVSANKETVADNDDIEISPLKLLLFQI